MPMVVERGERIGGRLARLDREPSDGHRPVWRDPIRVVCAKEYVEVEARYRRIDQTPTERARRDPIIAVVTARVLENARSCGIPKYGSRPGGLSLF
jgi:hypothetical protein